MKKTEREPRKKSAMGMASEVHIIFVQDDASARNVFTHAIMDYAI